MKFSRNLLASCFLSLVALGFMQTAAADERIDIKNDTADACSVAFNTRVDKTKWLTIGWYVFMAGEEAPVILKGANNFHDIFIYHDCDMQLGDNDEVKKGWVKVNLKFSDYIPMENAEGYKEVQFVRLNDKSYTITQSK